MEEERNSKERWRMINEMRGNKKEARIPDRIIDEKGNLTRDIEETMRTWKRHFEKIGKMKRRGRRWRCRAREREKWG